MDDATNHGSEVWSSPAVGYVHQLWVWHWCTRELYNGVPGWAPGGVGRHTLVSREPLHLEPSVFWRECCGKHGWIRDGQWADA